MPYTLLAIIRQLMNDDMTRVTFLITKRNRSKSWITRFHVKNILDFTFALLGVCRTSRRKRSSGSYIIYV